MRKRFLWVGLAVVGWVFFAPNPWASVARAQSTVTLLNVTGTMSSSNALNPRGSAYFAGVHTIALTAGASYTMPVLSTAPAGVAYPGDDTYMYLLGPSGAVVAQDDDSNSSVRQWSSKITYTAATSGTYTIVVTSYSPGVTMPYSLTVTGPPASAVAPGSIPNVKVDPARPDAGTLVAAWNLNREGAHRLLEAELPTTPTCWMACATDQR